jgi:hypothetical protein
MDFTFKTYQNLLNALLLQGFSFQTLSAHFIQNQAVATFFREDQGKKLIILRHDVESKYESALAFAIIQKGLGISGSYYFRLFNKPQNDKIIRQIAELGHEIGYHYDDLSYFKGDHEKAIQRFENNLKYLRGIAPVKTITMEGAPLSKYDNRQLWEKYNYRDFGIIAEPYFDLDFDDIFYLTDTGRRWDGWRVSLRDKVPQQEAWIKQGLVFHSTRDIIKAANEGRLPEKIMMTFHPQRWNDKPLRWLKELVWQGVKNVGKRFLLKMRS